MDHSNEFPKTIWLLWFQGIEAAPFVVKKCYESWIRHNPTWKVILLDENNLTNYYFTELPKIAPQAQSDIIRINLLATYGGIWVDATCFCMKPLDMWIDRYLTTGFFAFNKPGPDRMISSWFLACSKNNYIATVYQNEVNRYWQINKRLTLIENSYWKVLGRYLATRPTKIWFGFFTTQILCIYPYFWFHYLFEKIYRNDRKVKEIWDNTTKISADLPHALQFSGLLNPLNEEVKKNIDDKITPVYKLAWKYDIIEYTPETILGYLLKSIP
jgi:hypothetical protein